MKRLFLLLALMSAFVAGTKAQQNLRDGYVITLKGDTLHGVIDFHTHPDGKLGATEAIPQQSKDVQRKNAMKQTVPNATFIVLYRPYSNMEEYDYTDN